MTSCVTLDECHAALDCINDAPKSGAVIEELCFRPDFGEREFPNFLECSIVGGIKGERWSHSAWLKLPDGKPDPRIQVSIFSKRVMDLCWRDRERQPHPGDSIVVDMDLSSANLPIGSRLRAGGVELEVSDKFNTACVKWQKRYGDESLRWINLPENRPYRLRGVLCKIVRDGVVRVGDKLEKI